MTRKAIFIFLTLSAILCTVYMQSGIKPKPQVWFIGFSALTTIMLFTKVKIIPSVLYSVLIGAMFYLMFFGVCMLIIDIIAPERVTGYLEDGRKVKFMDFTFVYAAIIGLILSLISVFIYVRNRNKMGLVSSEKYFALTIFIATFIGYYIYELWRTASSPERYPKFLYYRFTAWQPSAVKRNAVYFVFSRLRVAPKVISTKV